VCVLRIATDQAVSIVFADNGCVNAFHGLNAGFPAHGQGIPRQRSAHVGRQQQRKQLKIQSSFDVFISRLRTLGWKTVRTKSDRLSSGRIAFCWRAGIER
jgi:hypothetical protein